MVELLTVIAIIGILATLLLPAISRARQRGTTVSCVGNLKQIGAIIPLYSADNGGMMPQLDKIDRTLEEYDVSRGNSGDQSLSWTCPARNKSLKYVTDPNPVNYSGSLNAFDWVSPTSGPAKRLSNIMNTSMALLLADGRENQPWGSWIFIDNADGNSFLYCDRSDPLSEGFNYRPWFESRGYSKTDTVYVAGADVDSEGAPSGIRYRHNGNTATVALFADGRVSVAPIRGLVKGNFITAW